MYWEESRCDGCSDHSFTTRGTRKHILIQLSMGSGRLQRQRDQFSFIK